MGIDKIKIDLSKVISTSQMQGEDQEEKNDLFEAFKQATEYITSFSWCKNIKETYLGIGYPGIICIFLFRIQPTKENVDEWNWVIVGDLPPAYISAYGFPNPATALDGYIGAMSDWVEAVKAGKDVSKLIPVNVPATIEWAEELDKRLKFLRDEILSDYEEDLTESNET